MVDHVNIAGWREWVSLPELGIPFIKAKLDTGARTSTIHAFSVEHFRSGGRDRVRFGMHPLQKKKLPELFCEADILDRRMVSDSGGHRERRFIIRTPIRLGKEEWTIEASLTDRDGMLFRMLLGRTALIDRFMVDPAASFLFGRHVKDRKRAYAQAPSHASTPTERRSWS